ncbi:ABC transporter substrate-binding protein [Streptomyces sp. NPDC052042]|uniref:ABC transporter substrate-binding protein n=1 Tax=Streptomyces sp. NPDC052042 TaxID=3365683 RepID=UPI0037CD5841
MRERTVWQFSDDRGQVAAAARRPARVLAYVQAGATLWDHGIRPTAIFGSDHDDPAVPDTAKTGSLPTDTVAYAGAGSALDTDTLLGGGPDLVVAVTYGGGHVYALAPQTAKQVEEQVPVVVIDVSRARSFAQVAERFAQLARSLGAEQPAMGTRDPETARDRLRTLCAGARRPRVLALSPAGQERTHLARPRMWPELRVLAELGVDPVEPADGPGASWATVDWAEAAALRPDIVLADVRANATPLDDLRTNAEWAAIERTARVIPWNPEPVFGPQAHARFLGLVADAVEDAPGR